MNTQPWLSSTTQEIVDQLKTSLEHGLSTQEAHHRLKDYGPNILPEQKKKTILTIFLHQFSNVIPWILIGAAIIALFLHAWIDALAISTIIFLNALIGFAQEYTAEKTVQSLRSFITPTSTVLRDGIIQKIPSVQLVPGDIVLLKEGDQVPADGRIIASIGLATQEAALTGESATVHKIIDPIPQKKLAITDQLNMAFMGTIVVNGKGTMIITASGSATEFGTIALLLNVAPTEPTPLEKNITQLGHILLITSIGLAAIIILFGLSRGTPITTLALMALSLAIAAIPEGLPTIVTLTLVLGMKKMAQRNALVRTLSSVETLGCTTIICSDKTGTLTQNKMTVRYLWVNNTMFEISGNNALTATFKKNNLEIDPAQTPDLMFALNVGILSNPAHVEKKDNAWHVLGDPTEGSLVIAAAQAGLLKKIVEKQYPLIEEMPFDQKRRRTSMLRVYNQSRRLFVKGSFNNVLELCTHIWLNEKIELLHDEYKQHISSIYKTLASQGLRLLALAYKNVESNDPLNESLEQKLVFVGLTALIDPPRPEVKKAIEQCKKAGIIPIMITGDDKDTAIAIAQELGIMESNTRAIDGTEFDDMGDAEFKKAIRTIRVYARTSPEDKMRIVTTWKSLGEIVAMTGDGVNDAPALKVADIGIAMGITGTHVAQEASDILLLDDNFASIITAVREGRGIYNNIIKSINYLISSNIAEIIIIFVSTFLVFKDPHNNPYVPLLPLQLLWINLLTDGLPALAMSLDPVPEYLMKLSPRNAHAPIISFTFAIELVVISMLLACGALYAGYVGLQTSSQLANTMAFTTLIMLEFVRVHIVRTKYFTPLFSNVWLFAALGCSILLQLLIIYVPALQTVFKTTALTISQWFIIGIVVIIVGIVSYALQLFFDYMNRPSIKQNI